MDGYWPDTNIVVEYRERQHDRPVAHFDKPDRLTVSGVHRRKQRGIYDARRYELIPSNDGDLPAGLDATPRGRLGRNLDEDRAVISNLLRG